MFDACASDVGVFSYRNTKKSPFATPVERILVQADLLGSDLQPNLTIKPDSAVKRKAQATSQRIK